MALDLLRDDMDIHVVSFAFDYQARVETLSLINSLFPVRPFIHSFYGPFSLYVVLHDMIEFMPLRRIPLSLLVRPLLTDFVKGDGTSCRSDSRASR